MKEFAPACERNKAFILGVLQEILVEPGTVYEIGSGTGQHAAYFAQHLPHLYWRPCDLPEWHASIGAYISDAGLQNLLPPLEIELLDDHWPIGAADAIVCINTIHIVAWRGVENLFRGVGKSLRTNGIFYVYGPYRYADRPLEPSNERFDEWLKLRDPVSGVRAFEDVDALAQANRLELLEDRPMPANNRSIWWRKR